MRRCPECGERMLMTNDYGWWWICNCGYVASCEDSVPAQTVIEQAPVFSQEQVACAA